jgi:dTDP-4-amino-4,6-dideoxygalactose transaminase
VQNELRQLGVETAVHYPIPLHLQPMYEHLGYKNGRLPEAEKAAGEVLSLPIYPHLLPEEIHYVGGALKQVMAKPEMRTKVTLARVS